MRISDWSSDVCSSDLFHNVSRCRPPPEKPIPFAGDGKGAVAGISCSEHGPPARCFGPEATERAGGTRAPDLRRPDIPADGGPADGGTVTEDDLCLWG